MHDNKLFKVSGDLQIVFWGAKYVILRNSKSDQVELIPTSEIKHTMIRSIEWIFYNVTTEMQVKLYHKTRDTI